MINLFLNLYKKSMESDNLQMVCHFYYMCPEAVRQWEKLNCRLQKLYNNILEGVATATNTKGIDLKYRYPLHRLITRKDFIFIFYMTYVIKTYKKRAYANKSRCAHANYINYNNIILYQIANKENLVYWHR